MNSVHDAGKIRSQVESVRLGLVLVIIQGYQLKRKQTAVTNIFILYLTFILDILYLMFVTAVCFLFLLKLKWPKDKSIYDINCKKVNNENNCVELRMFVVIV